MKMQTLIQEARKTQNIYKHKTKRETASIRQQHSEKKKPFSLN